MAIIANRNLLGCSTLRDWSVVRSERPDILGDGAGVPDQYRNMLLYFAMQGAAPFHVCITLYRRQILLIHGAAELRTLLDFLFGPAAPVERKQWHCPQPLPGDKPRFTVADLSYWERERILSTPIAHSDFTVESQEDLEFLRAYYGR